MSIEFTQEELLDLFQWTIVEYERGVAEIGLEEFCRTVAHGLRTDMSIDGHDAAGMMNAFYSNRENHKCLVCGAVEKRILLIFKPRNAEDFNLKQEDHPVFMFLLCADCNTEEVRHELVEGILDMARCT